MSVQFDMHIEFDSFKSQRNFLQRGLSFDRVADFDFESAKVWQDTRLPYSEVRYVALGYLTYRLHVLCFTPVLNGIRVISLRKANAREGAKHGFSLTHSE
jgi:uncharacterized DUF497 family protein